MTLRTFNTSKELFDFLAERAERGNAALKVWQRDMPRDAFAFQLIVNQARAPWPIFWEVVSGPTLDDEGKVAGDIPVASYHRMVKLFSELDPNGRIQQVHVGDAWGTIDQHMFDVARAMGWQLPPDLRFHFDFVFRRHAEMQKGAKR